MSLDEYRRKRNPARTPEPAAGRPKGGDKQPVFVVQRHDARRLHYDLRLEMEGALASWALPKGLPLEPGERYLAVHVEDHPMEYADFSGVIPKGQYGAGTMEIWDRGRYELVERKKDGGLTVRLNGKRLSGLWTLVPANLGGEERNWLLIKKHDTDEAAPAAAPVGYAPMLATAADRLPSKGEWLFEVKLDGYRAISRLEGGEASLTSRGGHDLGRVSPRFAAPCPTPCAPATASSTASCACWTNAGGRTSASCSAERDRPRTTCSTCSSWSAGRCSTCRWSSVASSSRRCWSRATRWCGSRPGSQTASRCWRRCARRTSREWSPNGWDRPTGRVAEAPTG